MARHKMVNGIKVMFTPEEEAFRDAEELEWSKTKPLEDWKADMQRADNDVMPRYVEDILDGMPDKSGVAQITLDNLQAKKDLRATKP